MGSAISRLVDIYRDKRDAMLKGLWEVLSAFYANGGGEGFIRLAYSWQPPERSYERAKLIAQAIRNAR